MINVQPYQPRIPISGGGGHIDLRERPGPNPIVQVLQQIIGQKRQKEQDELNRRLTEAKIGQMGREKQTSGKIVIGSGKTWLVDPQTGEKRDLGIPAPKGKAATELLNAWLKLGQFEEPTPREEAIRGVLGQEILGGFGLEEGEEEYTHDPWWGKPRTKTRKVIRKKAPSPITGALEGQPETGKVKMKAPDGKEYLVPIAEVKEAQKRGWKRL